MTEEQIKQEALNSDIWFTCSHTDMELDNLSPSDNYTNGFTQGAKWALSQPNPVIKKLKELVGIYGNTDMPESIFLMKLNKIIES